MSVINILSPHVADLIAAGEVVERPASVIKELMENSFDAGAGNITVEIHNGGSTYIRVADDGYGMSPDDAGLAFTRHATSKLSDESGLGAISTMGFRGEALAAISSVSRIELVTARPGDSEGTYVSLEGGEITEMHSTGCPSGTTVTVTDIFYNTPARLKFLKSDRSEASACVSAAMHCSLGRPDVSVRLLRDGREEFFSPGDGNPESCVYALLGRDFAGSCLGVAGSSGGVSVSGFVSSPSACRGNRSMQHFYCNGRYIKSSLLQAAVEQAYRNSLLTGRYPGCVIYLELEPGTVDVNVHPAKTEIKFTDEKLVFSVLYHTVLAALSAEDTASSGLPVQPAAEEVPARVVTDTAPAAPAPAPADDALPKPEPSAATEEISGTAETVPAVSDVFLSPERGYQTSLNLTSSAPVRQSWTPVSSGAYARVSGPAQDIDSVPPVSTAPAIDFVSDVDNSVQNVENSPEACWKIAGELFRTYIIVELEDRFVLIDKHAAHERMIFDRLKARRGAAASQALISPVTYRPSADDRAAVSAGLELLTELGFEIEAYGPGEYIIRALPADMELGDVIPAIEEICGRLRAGGEVKASDAGDEALRTVACKAAIKAGYDNSPEELRAVAESVMSGAVRYCPHGRPVSHTVTRTELEKLFKRIV